MRELDYLYSFPINKRTYIQIFLFLTIVENEDTIPRWDLINTTCRNLFMNSRVFIKIARRWLLGGGTNDVRGIK